MMETPKFSLTMTQSPGKAQPLGARAFLTGRTGWSCALEHEDSLKAGDTYWPFPQLLPASGQCDSLKGDQTHPVSCSHLLRLGTQAR